MLRIPSLYIVDTEHRGRGVFCSESLGREDLIEICPVIIIPPNQVADIDRTVLYDYYFEYPEPKGAACIALGFGSLYNHSSEPNAQVVFDLNDKSLQIHALHSISPGSEIKIDYLAGESKKLWFEIL